MPNQPDATTSVKFLWRTEGGHVRVRVFTSEFGPQTTHGKNGELVFRTQEWDAVLAVLGSSHGVDDGRPTVFHSFYDPDVHPDAIMEDVDQELVRFTFIQTPDR